MSLTVANALKLPCFHEAKILAGTNGLNRKIRTISVVECPDFPIDLDIIGKR